MYGIGYVTKGFPKPKSVHPMVWRVVSPVFNPIAAFLTTGGMPPRTGRRFWGCLGVRGRNAFINNSRRCAGRGR